MNNPDPLNPTDAEVKPLVLVVDDTPEYLTVLGEILQATCTVRVANSGRRALELAARLPLPDLMLLDVMMPDMDGFQVLAALRADPLTREIPAIFITGLDTPTDELAGLQLGAADYIVKPLAAPVVLARVKTQIALKRARDKERELNQALQARTAALEQTVEDLETFSYSLSHDLRSPLATISGFADLLQRFESANLTPEGQRRLGRVAESAKRMDLTIRDILACMHAQRADIHLRPVDLNVLVNETLQECAPAYPATRVTIGPLPVVQADPTMVRQVFSNLLGNAFKFSARADAPHVQVGMQPGAAEAGAEIFVRDTGAGFDPQYAGKLFSLFQRMHAQTDFAGTGVGLAIVKRLVQRHGGSIYADAAPGRGATFSFTLWPEGGLTQDT